MQKIVGYYSSSMKSNRNRMQVRNTNIS